MGTSQEKIGLRRPKSNVIVWKLFPLPQILLLHSDKFTLADSGIFLDFWCQGGVKSSFWGIRAKLKWLCPVGRLSLKHSKARC